MGKIVDLLKRLLKLDKKNNVLREFLDTKILPPGFKESMARAEQLKREFPGVEELTITNSIRSLQGIFEKFPNLKRITIDSKIEDLSPLLPYKDKLETIEILSEKDSIYSAESFLRVSLKKLQQLGEIPAAQKGIQNLRIVIPEGFGENDSEVNSFEQVVEMIDKLKNKQPGKTQLEITSFTRMSDKDRQILESRYGITFVYQMPIQVLIPLERDITDLENNLHGDEIAKIRNELDDIFSEMKVGGDIKDKVHEGYRIMQEKFKLKEVTSMEMSGLDVMLGAKKNEESGSELLTGLRTKIITPKSYICIASELLKRMGIKGMQYSIKKRHMDSKDMLTKEQLMLEVFGTT